MEGITVEWALKILAAAEDAPGKIPPGMTRQIAALIAQQAAEIERKDRIEAQAKLATVEACVICGWKHSFTVEKVKRYYCPVCYVDKLKKCYGR